MHLNLGHNHDSPAFTSDEWYSLLRLWQTNRSFTPIVYNGTKMAIKHLSFFLPHFYWKRHLLALLLCTNRDTSSSLRHKSEHTQLPANSH